MAPKNVLRHQKKCYDTKKYAAAQKRVLLHQKMCYGTKKFAMAIRNLLWPKKWQIITLFFFQNIIYSVKKLK